MRDVLLTGKVKEAVTRTADGRRVYDAVVLDAPPTGRIGRFLNVTAETARLAKIGPIKTQSEGVAAVLRSPVTAVHVVTLLEEMPVQETADAVAELHRARPPGRHGHRQRRPSPPLLAKGKVTQAELARGLVAAGLPADKDDRRRPGRRGAGAPGPARAGGRRCAPSWPRSAGRWWSCRCCRAGSTCAGLYDARPACCSASAAGDRRRAPACMPARSS